MKVAKEKNLPDSVIDFFIGENEDSTIENLTKLETEYTKAVQAAVDAKFKSGGREIPGGNPPKDDSLGAKFAQGANQQAKPIESNIWNTKGE